MHDLAIDENNEEKNSDTDTGKTYSSMTKILICVAAAVLSSTLQFAFIFGGEI